MRVRFDHVSLELDDKLANLRKQALLYLLTVKAERGSTANALFDKSDVNCVVDCHYRYCQAPIDLGYN